MKWTFFFRGTWGWGWHDGRRFGHARSQAQSKMKKKKRSHIRFGVTLLDTGNERRTREHRKAAPIPGKTTVQLGNMTCVRTFEMCQNSMSYILLPYKVVIFSDEPCFMNNEGMRCAWSTWHFAICLGREGNDDSTGCSANYPQRDVHVMYTKMPHHYGWGEIKFIFLLFPLNQCKAATLQYQWAEFWLSQWSQVKRASVAHYD